MAANFGDFAEGIPLDLNPLLSLYGRNKRLALRVERLPERARLSRGRNNGDRTWTLTREDLIDLRYQPPESLVSAHTLGIRIVNLDSDDCATLAMLDFPVSPPKDAKPTARSVGTSPAEGHDSSRLVKDEMGRLGIRLAQREKEVNELRAELEQVRVQQGTQNFELNAARSTWEAELESEVASLRAEARRELETRESELKGQIASLRADARRELEAREVELSKGQAAQIEKARARWQSEAEAALAKAKEAWRAEESVRRAQAETQWREHTTQAIAEMTQRARNAESALTRAEADSARLSGDSVELRRLRGELAEVNTALNARARELAEVRHALELARAEEFRGKAEFAAARADWQRELEQRIAQTRTEAAGMTAALQSDATAEASERAVADRLEQARLQWERESTITIQQAKETWKAEESARMARTEEQWRDKSSRALAESAARLERAEAALARAQTAALHESVDSIDLRRLREELATTQTALGDRETRLAQGKLEMQRARERWKIESDNAMRKAQEAWKAEEAYRVSVLRGDWQKDMHTTRISSADIDADVKESSHSYGRLVRDGMLAAALAVAVVVLYPSITPFITQWLPGGYFESSVNASQAALQKPEHLTVAPAPVAAPPALSVSVNSANVRSDASSTADVVTTVKRGAMVVALDRRGSWQHVRVGTGTQAQDGWVFAAFLTQPTPAAH